MFGILNFSAAAKGMTASTAAGGGAARADVQGGLGSFGAMLAQIMTGDGEGAAPKSGKVSELAKMLGQFRAEAQASLEETFPDDVIVPGPEFNEWARNMLTRLDTMLQEAGATVSDLTQVLAPLDGLTDPEAEGSALSDAAQILTGGPGPAVATPAVAKAPDGAAAPLVTTPAQGGPAATPQPTTPPVAGEVVAAGSSVTPAQPTAAPDAVTGAVTPQIEVAQSDVTAQPDTLAEAVTRTEAPLVAKPSGQVDAPQAAAPAAPDAAPLPEALRIFLAQAVVAPADRTMPPDVQVMLSAPQPAAAPMISSIVAVAPEPPAPSAAQQTSVFARNIAGQVRGVSFSEGTTRIELSPQGLGKLEIEIAPDEAGKLRVVIRAENPAVLNAMRSDREMLAGLLRDGGASVENSAMSFEDLGQRRNAAPQDLPGSVGAAAVTEAEDEDPAPAAASPVADGRLDILT